MGWAGVGWARVGKGPRFVRAAGGEGIEEWRGDVEEQPLLSTRRKQYQHELDLQREKQTNQGDQAKKLPAKKSKMKIDGSDKKRKGAASFKIGKKKGKIKLSALAKAKAAQAMEVDK